MYLSGRMTHKIKELKTTPGSYVQSFKKKNTEETPTEEEINQ